MTLLEVEPERIFEARKPKSVGQEYREIVRWFPNFMSATEINIADLDKTTMEGGIVPRKPDGTLDLQKLHDQSPYTLDIFADMAEHDLYGIPFATITGKSFTAVLLAKLQKEIRYDYAYRMGMLEEPYQPESRLADFNFKGRLIIKPEFIEPNTGLMYAAFPDGTPNTNRLSLSYFGLDNGGRIINTDTGEMDTSHFPDAFFDIFTRPDVVELLRDTTRDSKKERQTRIMSKYNWDRSENATVYSYSYERWERAVNLTSDFSYPSPEEGAKFNLELALNRILQSESLRSRWKDLATSLGVEDTTGVMDAKGELSQSIAMDAVALYIKSTLLALFPKELASVTINTVDEGEKGMGKRTIIDLNPPNINKHMGFLKIVKSLNTIYKIADIKPPKFINRRVTLGDGPATNDESLICALGGWTNSRVNHQKFLGFPVYNGNLLQSLDVRVHKPHTLSKLEHTALFIKLLKYYRLDQKITALPGKLSEKVLLPAGFSN